MGANCDVFDSRCRVTWLDLHNHTNALNIRKRFNAKNLNIIHFAMLLFSHFGFEGGTSVLISPVSGHCLPFTDRRRNTSI